MSHTSNPRRKGFALILVLICLAMAVTMAALFLASAADERRGVDTYARGSQVRHLSGMAVASVIGRINQATKEGTAADPVSWASQPGMVRTFAANGDPANVYKLYSWDNPVEAGTGFNSTDPQQAPPSDWRTNTALFTDLNQPINDVYPIVDPRAERQVEGFSVDELNPIVGGTDLENAPMPVKWLYVLEDGRMVAPSGSGATATVAGATQTNPIIGRVAYWTDDETSKVNINTASEGNYWDIPRSGSRDDVQFAGNPPVSGEFQRTPGHPAMTSLSAIFPELLTENASFPTQTRWLSSYATQVQKIYAMSPRVAWGQAGEGSRGGTFPITSYGYNYGPPRGAISTGTLPKKVTPDTDRLYATVDDFWFQPMRQPNDALLSLTNGVRDLQRRLFFLTANSRAPETTLFETPRISLWPVTWPNASSYYTTRANVPEVPAAYRKPTPQDPNTTKLADINPIWITAEERLLAFCASLNTQRADGGDRYFFQRKDPDSPINDWNLIQRNQDLVSYLIAQMRKDVPGYGSSLQQGWGGGAPTTAWIGFNVFDYVRSLVNQFTAPNAQEGLRYSFTGVSTRQGRLGGVAYNYEEEPNAKMPTPLRATIEDVEHRGIGAFPQLEEVTVVFYAAEREEPIPPDFSPGASEDDKKNPESANYPEWRNPFLWQNLINLDGSNGYLIGARTTKMRAVMLLDFTGLDPGVTVKPTFWVKVTGPSFLVNGTEIGLPSTSGLKAQISLDTSSRTPAASTLFKGNAPKVFNNDNDLSGANVWQLVSDDISVSGGAVDFEFEGSSITVEVYACDPTNVDVDPTGNPARKVYQKTIDFSQWNSKELPMPMAPRWSMASRAYRFDDGGELRPGTAGGLPGGTRPKTAVPPNPTAKSAMEKFDRVSDGGKPLPARFDLWQPNPGMSPNWEWAWSEYAPTLRNRDNANPAAPDIRSRAQIFQNRVNNTHYVYRTSNQAGWNRDTDDPDEDREMGASQRNLSTNFRKRVGAVSQRNTDTRAAFCLEGHDAKDPFNFTDPNATFDYFIQSNDERIYESLPLLTAYDTVISMVNDVDPRLANVEGNDAFQKITTIVNPLEPATVISSQFPRTTTNSQWHAYGSPGILPNVTGYQILPTFEGKNFARSGLSIPEDEGGNLGGGLKAGSAPGANVGVLGKVPVSGDWTGMAGRYADGGWLIRPDQEYTTLSQDTSGGMFVPYWPRKTYGDNLATAGSGTAITSDLSFFSPNRQVPSPVILGTLPSSRSIGWQTLAFSPNPANPAHPGIRPSGNRAPDHLLLDLLWMPIVEPYPISEQLSTAGKVNLNYRIMPFSYITRKTALHALMKNNQIAAIEATDRNIERSKSHQEIRDSSGSTRFAINIDQTLSAFDAKFDANDLFRSASQICEMFLVPRGSTLGSITNFWDTYRLTADNAREQPYSDLYSRITTKSNTFTVHWRAQSLQKAPTGDAGTWNEATDRVAAELRGATLIERFIDPNATNIPDYATDPDAETLANFYKWRTITESFFQPK